MDSILGIVKSVFVVSLFSGILIHLAPDNKNQKYIMFVSEIMLIIICITPVISLLKKTDIKSEIMKKIEYYCDIGNENLNLDMESLGENKIQYYKNCVISDINENVYASGMYPVKTDVVIDSDEDSKTYGKLQKITIKLGKYNGGQTDNKNQDKIIVDNINKIENISISGDKIGDKDKDNSNENILKTDEEIRKLRDFLAQSYSLNKENVVVFYENE